MTPRDFFRGTAVKPGSRDKVGTCLLTVQRPVAGLQFPFLIQPGEYLIVKTRVRLSSLTLIRLNPLLFFYTNTPSQEEISPAKN